jgi:hypothetical protein
LLFVVVFVVYFVVLVHLIYVELFSFPYSLIR